MTDAPVVAALLAAQRRRRDPFESQRQFGDTVMKQALTPVQSWGEGLAKMLQAGVGGYFSGQADRKADERDQNTVKAIGGILAAPTAEARAAKIAELKGAGLDTEMLGPLMGQLLSQQMADDRKAQLGQRSYQAAGGGGATMMPPPGPGGAIATQPLPQGTVMPGGFNNNAGNIRATNLPWEGKGPPQNGFETFATPQAGANAMFKNLGAYVQANPGMTVAQAIAKWAPPNENNTQGYISRLSEATGINPGMPLAEVMKDQAVAATLMDGITRIEKGGMPQGFSADTFMQAAAPQPMQGPAPVAQGDAGAPQRPTPAPRPTHDPGADYEALGQRAADAKDFETATKYQMEANKARAAFKTKQFEEDEKRAFEGPEFDRRKAFDNTSKLRGDFEGIQQVKDYRKARGVMQSAVEALGTNSAAADLNLVYAFATMMDPGSVVREGEMGMVKATQSASDQVKALVAMVSGGQRISPEARAALADQMYSRFTAYKQAHDQLADSYGGIAQRGGYNRDDVVIPMPEVKYTPKGSAIANIPGEAVSMLRANPSLRDQFDQKYGKGASAKVLEEGAR